MTPISPASDTRTGKTFDPFASFAFHVEIGSIKEAAFTECSGLELSNDVFEYQEGGLNEYTHRLPGRTKYSNVTLRRGFAQSNELFDWYKEMEGNLLQGKAIERKQVTISLYDPTRKSPVTWILADAIPVRWVGPNMKSDEATVAIEALEFAHHGIRVS